MIQWLWESGVVDYFGECAASCEKVWLLKVPVYCWRHHLE